MDFVEAQTLTQATNAARQSLKFLVVYIPSGVSREEKKHQAFLKTLADAAVGVGWFYVPHVWWPLS